MNIRARQERMAAPNLRNWIKPVLTESHTPARRSAATVGKPQTAAWTVCRNAINITGISLCRRPGANDREAAHPWPGDAASPSVCPRSRKAVGDRPVSVLKKREKLWAFSKLTKFAISEML